MPGPRLVSDIELIDDYPSHFSAYSRRKHRWVRGDWQIHAMAPASRARFLPADHRESDQSDFSLEDPGQPAPQSAGTGYSRAAARRLVVPAGRSRLLDLGKHLHPADSGLGEPALLDSARAPGLADLLGLDKGYVRHLPSGTRFRVSAVVLSAASGDAVAGRNLAFRLTCCCDEKEAPGMGDRRRSRRREAPDLNCGCVSCLVSPPRDSPWHCLVWLIRPAALPVAAPFLSDVVHGKILVGVAEPGAANRSTADSTQTMSSFSATPPAHLAILPGVVLCGNKLADSG